jgi:Rod binding domain-containing protein
MPSVTDAPRGIALQKSSVRPLRKSAADPAAQVRRFTVEDLKKGQDFNEILLPGADKKSPEKSAPNLVNNDPSSPDSQDIADSTDSADSADSPDSTGNQSNQTSQTSQAALAGLAAQSRYLGRKNPVSGSLIRNKSADLTEEEKIGQLKKIKKSAEDYEGLLMKEMIKSIRQNPLVKTAGSETYSEIAEKPFTAALTAAGGLGLAEKIVSDVARQEGLMDTLNEHPEIMGPNYRPKIAPSRMRKAPGGRIIDPNPYANNPSAAQGDEAQKPI